MSVKLKRHSPQAASQPMVAAQHSTAQLLASYPARGVVIVSGGEGGLVPDGVVATAVME